jgi:GDP/UDP-N,N'-diacetylbacillosamine 2-epimerase (hydrolysing)
MLSASIAALYARIPIAHIHGGESTAGAFDDTIRHSITKMSWWHFVANDEYKKRVVQLGENPKRVFNVGGLGVDAIKKTKLLSKTELTEKTGIKFNKKNLLITYHPVTLDRRSSKKYFQSLLDILASLDETYLIFTMPNADSDGRIIKQMINDFVLNNTQRSISFISMGHLNYSSTMQFVDCVVGNSSSGLAEAPTFKIGTINIGDRQRGRIKAESVIDCEAEYGSIKNAFDTLYSEDFQKKLLSVKNPYGKGNAIKKILKVLKTTTLPNELKKDFFDL